MRRALEAAMQVGPAELAAAILGGQLKLTVVKNLVDGPLRFGALGRAVGSPNPRVLTRQLRELEHDGIVHRRVRSQVPPHVEYSLTAIGESLQPAIRWIEDWGRAYPYRSESDSGSALQ